MKDILAPVYEYIIGYRAPDEGFNDANDIYFDVVYNSLDYTFAVLIMIIISIGIWFIFYRGIDYPLPKRAHYLFTLILIPILSFLVFTYLVLPNSSMLEFTINEVGPSDEYMSPSYFNFLMGIVTAGISLIVGILLGLLIKPFSINNKKNPF